MQPKVDNKLQLIEIDKINDLLEDRKGQSQLATRMDGWPRIVVHHLADNDN